MPKMKKLSRKAKRKKKINSKQLLINLSLTIIVLIIFFAFFEITLRIIEPKPKYERQNEFIFYEYHNILGWKNKPNSNGTLYMPDSASFVSINSKGLRDSEHSYEKEPGVKRIQFYGDSLTWGYGVDNDDRYTAAVGRSLEQLFPGRYEVMNFATTGYSTDQDYLLLKIEGVKYQPDLVIFAYHNGIMPLTQDEAYTYYKPLFVLENNSLRLTNIPVPQRAANWTDRTQVNNDKNLLRTMNSVFSVSKVYLFFKKRILYSNLGTLLVNKALGQSFSYDDAIKILDALLLGAKKEANAAGVRFIIVFIPSKEHVYGNTPLGPERENILQLGEKYNITVINLLPEMKEIGKKEKNIYFRIDGHLSEEGNRIVGELLAKKLIEEGVIDGKE